MEPTNSSDLLITSERIFKDEGFSGASTERKGLDEALSVLNRGDDLVVWKLDRLGRSATSRYIYARDKVKDAVDLLGFTYFGKKRRKVK